MGQIDDKEIAKLLELAKDQPAKPKPIKTNPEIDAFISECKIVAGTKKIPSYIVYYYYVIWNFNRSSELYRRYNYVG